MSSCNAARVRHVRADIAVADDIVIERLLKLAPLGCKIFILHVGVGSCY